VREFCVIRAAQCTARGYRGALSPVRGLREAARKDHPLSDGRAHVSNEKLSVVQAIVRQRPHTGIGLALAEG